MEHALVTAAVFAAFAFVHSLTVSRAFKRRAAGLLGEDWMRAYYRLAFTALSAGTATLAVFIIYSLPDELLYTPDWYVYWPCRIVQAGGVALMLAAFRPFSFGLFSGVSQAAEYRRTGRTGGDIEGMPHGPLITTGAYSLVRHPMYTAGIMLFMFEPVVSVNSLVLRLLASAYFVYGGFIEERRFAADFGEEYVRYRREVPMFNIVSGVVRRLGRS
ncbi:MAG: isoprenylcysteine carboxylmethyltransferase family protein [Nitrospirae bacterium]|nr:isoprenylcysteine carboxylmethyltransferase family protein [Nitrospirota bacterium]